MFSLTTNTFVSLITMPAYAVVGISVHDPALCSQYLAKVAPLVEKHHGRSLSRGGKVTLMSV